MQRVRGLTQKHNSVSKRLHNLRAIAPRFWIVVALSSDASHIYTLRLGMPMLIYGETIAVRMRQTSFRAVPRKLRRRTWCKSSATWLTG
jgi:hypothetical protein